MKQEAHIARYAQDLTQVLGVAPDMALLHGVTTACGPLIYDPATEVVTQADLPAFRKSLIRKLDLHPGPAVDEAVLAAYETCATGTAPFRAVLVYVLALHFGKAAALRVKAG